MTSISQAQRGGRASKRQLWIAAALGLLAAILVIVFLSNAGSSNNNNSAVATEGVIVAAQPIAIGTQITADMLTTKQVATSAIAADAIRDKTLAIGQVARYPISRGDTLSTSELVSAPQVKSLSFEIPPGLRGMTIPVSINNTPSALIAPGDFVDVIVSADAVLLNGNVVTLPGNNQQQARGSATLLQNVQVLSVDRNFADTGVVYDSSVRGTPPEAKDSVSFVTLAVTPDQAQLLWLAQDSGKLTIVLRAFGDDKVVTLTPDVEPLTLP